VQVQLFLERREVAEDDDLSLALELRPELRLLGPLQQIPTQHALQLIFASRSQCTRLF
jgi:hypothetical protein